MNEKVILSTLAFLFAGAAITLMVNQKWALALCAAGIGGFMWAMADGE